MKPSSNLFGLHEGDPLKKQEKFPPETNLLPESNRKEQKDKRILSPILASQSSIKNKGPSEKSDEEIKKEIEK